MTPPAEWLASGHTAEGWVAMTPDERSDWLKDELLGPDRPQTRHVPTIVFQREMQDSRRRQLAGIRHETGERTRGRVIERASASGPCWPRRHNP